MAGETPITVIGNLTADPELRFTPSGAAVANFTVASTPRTFDRQTNEWKDAETLFMRCSVWREAAENVAESLTRGTRVVVTGRLVSRSWEDKETGQKRSVMEMQVDEVGPSLRYATAKVTKTQRGGGDGQGGGSWGGGQQGGAPQGGGFGGQQDDPWASGGQQGGAPQGGGFGGQQAPAQGGGNQGGGGWGSAPSYDEPPF
ncbi:single stranded DNA-binding protein [Janibacter hoylei PVAS-1]|uniref:Single-stranded DNA-binding protein n=1 Tax=Janibacter hoylei PVAS-1 TaxID=1210046 RepID=K1ERU3_9MICO|nr:single-stranded DNA-binding protein [Janibacter hoylei]EKA61918.1 single stranded DNA-binding protein [Janibacter hoylei PVAS-1]RWU84040.1 single-stranded DNA-binding protein [Janibacter hoylei PVAS-1]